MYTILLISYRRLALHWRAMLNWTSQFSAALWWGHQKGIPRPMLFAYTLLWGSNYFCCYFNGLSTFNRENYEYLLPKYVRRTIRLPIRILWRKRREFLYIVQKIKELSTIKINIVQWGNINRYNKSKKESWFKYAVIFDIHSVPIMRHLSWFDHLKLRILI